MRNSPDESLYSVPEQTGIEIDKEPHLLASNTKIRQNLGFENWIKPLPTLDFNDRLIFHKQVEAIFADLFSL